MSHVLWFMVTSHPYYKDTGITEGDIFVSAAVFVKIGSMCRTDHASQLSKSLTLLCAEWNCKWLWNSPCSLRTAVLTANIEAYIYIYTQVVFKYYKLCINHVILLSFFLSYAKEKGTKCLHCSVEDQFTLLIIFQFGKHEEENRILFYFIFINLYLYYII